MTKLTVNFSPQVLSNSCFRRLIGAKGEGSPTMGLALIVMVALVDPEIRKEMRVSFDKRLEGVACKSFINKKIKASADFPKKIRHFKVLIEFKVYLLKTAGATSSRLVLASRSEEDFRNPIQHGREGVICAGRY